MAKAKAELGAVSGKGSAGAVAASGETPAPSNDAGAARGSWKDIASRRPAERPSTQTTAVSSVTTNTKALASAPKGGPEQAVAGEPVQVMLHGVPLQATAGDILKAMGPHNVIAGRCVRCFAGYHIRAVALY